MLPKTHIILGAIFSLIIWGLFPDIGLLGFSVIFLSSFLIDVDHYLFYVWLKKDLSLKRSFKWFITKNKKFLALSKEQRKGASTTPCIFHGIEAIIILFGLYYFLQLDVFLFIIIGFLFHELLDFINIWYYGFNFNHIISQTKNIINYKNQDFS